MQDDFVAALTHQNEQLLDNIKGRSMAEKQTRFDVYRNNVMASLSHALEDIFPVCKTLVGEAFFSGLAQQYIRANLPTSAILSEYGAQFPDFVRQFAPAKPLPYLADVCELEYQLLQLTHAPEPSGLSLERAQGKLSQVQQPECLHLLLHAQCRLFKSPLAVLDIYQAHQSQQTSTLSTLMMQRSQYILLTKSGLYGQAYELTEAEYYFISRLSESSLMINALPEDETFDLGQSLAKWLQWQVFQDIYEEGQPLC